MIRSRLLICALLCSIAPLAFSQNRAAPSLSEAGWAAKVKSLDLPALVAFLDAPGSPRWPALPFSADATPARLALPLALFDRIEASEWSDPDFRPENAVPLAKTYVRLAHHLRTSGGYCNLLLADALYRAAATRLGRLATEHPEQAPQVEQLLGSVTLPVLTRDLVRTLLNEAPGSLLPVNEDGSFPRPGTRQAPQPAPRPATQPATLNDPKSSFDIALRDVTVRLDPARHPKNSGPAHEARWGTRSLLMRHNLRLLLGRLRGTDSYLALQLRLHLASLRGQVNRNEVDFLGPQFRAAYPNHFDAAALAMTDLMQLEKGLLQPGVAGFNHVPFGPYPSAVDLPPTRDFAANGRNPQQLTVTETVLPITPAEWVFSSFVASDNGASWAFVEPRPRSGGAVLDPFQQPQIRVVLNGKPGREFDRLVSPYMLAREQFSISADGKVVSYIASRAGKTFVVANTQEYGPYAAASRPSFGKDGTHRAWAIVKPASKTSTLVINGREVSTGIQLNEPVVFSPDGKQWAYRFQRPEAIVTRVEGVQEASRELPSPHRPVCFTSDSKHLISWNGTDSRPALLSVDGQVVAQFEHPFAEAPTSTPDGRAIRCRVGNDSFLVGTDGRIVQEWKQPVFFSPRTARVVLMHYGPAQTRRAFGATTYDFGEGRSYLSAGPPRSVVFLPDDRAMLVAQEMEYDVLVIDGAASAPYAEIAQRTLGFSPDGRIVAVGTRRGHSWRLTVNGYDTKETYDALLPCPAYFETPDSARFIAIRDDKLIQVRVRVSNPAPFNGRQQPAPANPPSVVPQ